MRFMMLLVIHGSRRSRYLTLLLVTRQLLLMARKLDFYGGITITELSENTRLDYELVQRIVNDFAKNDWVIKSKDKYEEFVYLPK